MNNRIGLHYFNDIQHFRNKDLLEWLPDMLTRHVGWLILQSPIDYAIPEEFISALVANHIEPIIQFADISHKSVKAEDLKVILNVYGKWGVKYVIFFNEPNLKSSWPDGTWNLGDIVDTFLDKYIPFVKAANQAGLTTVFPPLQPGGDYWDTAFLKKTLKGAINRKCLEIISNFHIAVSGQTFDKELAWGLGAISDQNRSKAYLSSIDIQDHIGFRTSDCYCEIIKQTIGYFPKILLFWYGTTNHLSPNPQTRDFNTLINLASRRPQNNSITPLNENIISCNFWPISNLNYLDPSLIDDTNQSSYAINLSEIVDNQSLIDSKLSEKIAQNVAPWVYPIDHYLLLPTYKWGTPEYILEKVRPIFQQDKPTIGFSIDEAMMARKVTVWNENGAFSDSEIEELRQSGCIIDEKVINGIEVALEVN
jgi:hypothetical protein